MSPSIFRVESAEWPRAVKLFGLVGALLQISLAFCIGFLPVFALCMGGEPSCRYLTYGEQGGSVFGYFVFTVMILLGLLVIVALMRPAGFHKARPLWIGAFASLGMVILSAWGLGITFLPGAILLLFAAFYSRRSPAQLHSA